MQTLRSAHCRHWGKECVAASEAHVSICAHSDNFWVSNLLSAFLTVLPFLPPENPLLFQPYSPASSSLIQIPASLLPGLAHLCSRVVFPWSVLLGCCEEELEPGTPCSRAKAVGCSSLTCSNGIVAAWLMGAVRSNVLCAEDSFQRMLWTNSKTFNFFINFTKSRQSQEFIPKSNRSFPVKF